MPCGIKILSWWNSFYIFENIELGKNVGVEDKKCSIKVNSQKLRKNYANGGDKTYNQSQE